MCAASAVVPVRPEHPAGADLAAVAALVGAPVAVSPGDRRLTGVTLRAQFARPGDLFAALPGRFAHGADFVPQALDAGAAAVLTDPAGAAQLGPCPVPVLVVDRPREVLGAAAALVYGDPSRSLTVVGVTGTSGKTTTSFLLDGALRSAGVRTGLIGTVRTSIDGTVTPSSLTTPEAPDLQALLARMAEAGVEVVVMEVSSHSLALGRVDGTTFAVGAFTNLSQDHLDFHPDMESYFEAKQLLFDGRCAREVAMVDDSWGARLARQRPGAVTVSTNGAPATYRLTASGPAGPARQRFELSGPDGEHRVEVGLPGPFNLANAALALVCAHLARPDLDTHRLAAGLADVVVPGRMERVVAPSGAGSGDPVVVVDYAHKPGALRAVLEAAATGLAGRLICVVGAGGDRDTGKREQMGAIAAQWADLVVVTDDNPRTEDPAAIRAAVTAGARQQHDRSRPGRAEIREIGSRAAAIEAAVHAAGPGDLVVIAGKGHEEGQEINGVVHHFSDREAAEAALAGREHTAQTGGTHS